MGEQFEDLRYIYAHSTYASSRRKMKYQAYFLCEGRKKLLLISCLERKCSMQSTAHKDSDVNFNIRFAFWAQ